MIKDKYIDEIDYLSGKIQEDVRCYNYHILSLSTEVDLLREKIDKAKEYIYRNWITYDEATKFTTFNEEMEICVKEIKEILEILGDKENE